MSQALDIIPFLEFAKQHPVIDARSEGEHQQGCMPGTFSLPILNTEERAIVGTTYKLQGRDLAVLKGFELVSHKFPDYIKQAQLLAPEKEIGIYCWRGGMRSGIMSWLLQTAGFKVTILNGGYKSFRHFCLDVLQKPLKPIVIGGQTGSGKTELLHQLKIMKEQVIDLEGWASHKGSTFGGLGQPPQPSQEQFENLIAWELNSYDLNMRVWLENESKAIGKLRIPTSLFTQMQNAPTFETNVPFQERLERATMEYGHFPYEALKENTLHLRKRMGGQHVKEALQRLEENNIEGWVTKLLEYYDKAYQHSKEWLNHKHTIAIDFNTETTTERAAILIKTAEGLDQ